MFKTLILLTCVLMSLLSGCAQHPETLPKMSLQQRTQYLNKMQHWKVTSRVGIRDLKEGHNLSMDWEQNHQTYAVRFYSPLVSDQATIIGRPNHVELKTSDGKTYTDTSAENLVFAHLGWSVPFTEMTFWIKGQPVPHLHTINIKYDSLNQLQSLQQGGWTIEYQDYMVQDGMSLPEKIVMNNGKLHIKIIIKGFKS